MNSTLEKNEATQTGTAPAKAVLSVRVYSYKKAQLFKRDYVRKNGVFLKFKKCSGSHRSCVFEIGEGESFDARGSLYEAGTTKWTAANCQTWAKFIVQNGELVSLNFDDEVIAVPHWVSVS